MVSELRPQLPCDAVKKLKTKKESTDAALDPSSFLLPQVTSNLGKMILKEEMEKSLPIRRKTRSLPDRTPFHTCECHLGGSESPG